METFIRPHVPIFLQKESQIFKSVADNLGLHTILFNILALQILNIFCLGYVFRTIFKNSAILRHFISIILGFFYTIFCFGLPAALEISCLPIIAWLSMAIKPSFFHHFFLIIAMCLLSYHQIVDMIEWDFSKDNQGFNITILYMILVQKLSAMVYNFYDGLLTKKDEGIFENFSGLRRENVIRTKPTLLQILSYSFNFSNILGGPFIFYQDYINFIEVTKNQKCQKKSEDLHKRNLQNQAVIKKLFHAILIVVIVQICENSFCDYNLFTDKDWLKNAPIWRKLLTSTYSVNIKRMQYYFFWKLAEAGCNQAGLGYDQENKNWDKISNVRISYVDLATNPQSSLNNWNIQSTKWLRLVVFDRAPKSLRNMMTFGLSAIWHGFWPAYYFFFINCHFSLGAYNNLKTTILPFAEKKFSKNHSFIYNLIWLFGSLLFHVTFNFMAISFMFLMSYERCYDWFVSCYFLPIILVMVGNFFPFHLIFGKETKRRSPTKVD